MAKKKIDLQEWFLFLVGIIATIGIGGLFINGTITGTILSFLPLIVHQVVGWAIVVGAVWNLIQKFM